MFSRRRFLSFATMAMVFLTVACAQKKSASDETVILQAYRLIDDQRTDEAIVLLERELSQNPERDDYKVVLASAYAHRGGIKIQKLVPLVTQMDKLKSPKNPFDTKSEKSLNDKVNNGVLGIAALLTQYVEATRTYSAVPVVDANQASYIQHAVSLLGEIGPKINPEDALYRAILQIVLFKHLLAEKLIGEFSGENSKGATCRVDLEVVNGAVIRLAKIMIDIYSDLQIASPSKKDEMKKLSVQTADSVSNVTIATTTMTVLDEASTIFLKHSVMENGFGKIFKCGSI